MDLELLTSQEFAKRLKIGRSLLFEWLREGVLIAGKHYFRVGRVLRFVWSYELIVDLLAISARAANAGDNMVPVVAPTRQHGGGNARRKLKINWDY